MLEYDIQTPITAEIISRLRIFDTIKLSGRIYAGRDAVLPKVVQCAKDNLLERMGIVLDGAVVFHTAVSNAGIGPTTSNKIEIESSIEPLSKYGVKIHLGKGSLKPETVQALDKNGALFAITPPVTALFCDKLKNRKAVAFPEEGMEAFYELEVVNLPAIIAIAHGETIFDCGGDR